MRISLTIDGISIDAPTGKEQGRFRIVQPGEVVAAVGTMLNMVKPSKRKASVRSCSFE